MSEHVHKWKATTHLDACHWYSWLYACTKECGATASTTTERDVRSDPWSGVWMEPGQREVTRDERGRFCKPYFVEVRCERCEELRRGAVPTHTVVIVAKDGTVERESTEDLSAEAVDVSLD